MSESVSFSKGESPVKTGLSRRAFLLGAMASPAMISAASAADPLWPQSPFLFRPNARERILPLPEQIQYNTKMLPPRDRIHGNLILCMDSSGSMKEESGPDNFNLQLQGTAAALESDEVLSVIKRYQGIAMTVVQFSGTAVQTVPWSFVADERDASTFAGLIRAQHMHGRGSTYISSGLALCERLMQSPPYRADNYVVDVSGDGQNDGGIALKPYMFRLAEKFNTRVNGIAICDKSRDLDDYFRRQLVTDEETFNRTGVPIGKVWRVASMQDFPALMRQKLVEEIAAIPAPRFG